MQQKPTPKFKLHRNVWVMTFTSMLTDISSEMLANIIPLFLYNVLGVRTSLIGLIDGIAESTASITKIFAGYISDRMHQRKWLAVLGYGLSTIAKPFYYLATTWGAVLGIRFTDRVGKGIRTAPRDALLAGSTEPEKRGMAFGIQRAGDTAGAFIGILIAMLIIAFTQKNTAVLTRPTFQTLVLVSIIPSVLAVLILAIGAKEIKPKDGVLKPSLSLKGMDKRFLIYLGVTILFTLGNSSDSFIILRGQERGLTLLQVMGMLLTFNAIYSILSTPIGILSDKIGRRRMILFGWLLYALIYMGFALSKTGGGIWALFGLYGVYYAFTEGSGKALIADLVPDEKRGTAYGLYAMAVGLSALPASAIAGVLWQGVGAWTGFGAPAPFFFGAGMSLLAGLLFWKFVK
jgi:MFS family permease